MHPENPRGMMTNPLPVETCHPVVHEIHAVVLARESGAKHRGDVVVEGGRVRPQFGRYMFGQF